jgi:hypothetical protein
MKPYEQLTRRGKFIRKNMARLVIYGCFILVCCHSCYKFTKEKARNLPEKDMQEPQPEDNPKSVYTMRSVAA